MIHGFNLSFVAKDHNQLKIIDDIINSQKPSKKNTIKIKLHNTIDMYIFKAENIIQIRVIDVSEFIDKKNVDNKDYMIFYSKFNKLVSKYNLRAYP